MTPALTIQEVSLCYAFMSFNPADNVHCQFFSLCVAIAPWYI